MTEHTFKKGDRVPTWLQIISPAYLHERLVFGKDCLVERSDSGCVVYPLSSLEDEAPCIHLPDAGLEDVHITGAPTTFFRWPRGDERNSDINLLDGPRQVTLAAPSTSAADKESK